MKVKVKKLMVGYSTYGRGAHQDVKRIGLGAYYHLQWCRKECNFVAGV
jgi:hypothetical protein